MIFSEFRLVHDTNGGDNIYITTSVLSDYSDWSYTYQQTLLIKVSCTTMTVQTYYYFNLGRDNSG